MNGVQRRSILVLCVLLFILALITPVRQPKPGSDLLRYFLRDTSSDFEAHIQDISKRHGLDFRLVKALIKAESHFDHKAISRKGAVGLMQLMPGTAKDMGVRNPFDPKENIEGGVRYLKYLLRRFDNDVTLALAAYNAGPEVVKRFKGVPPFPETRHYLKRVMQFYSSYKQST